MSDTKADTSAPSPDRFGQTALTAVWMAILLGFLVQGAVFAGKLLAGGKVPQAQLLVDVAGGISWSVIVCGGVAVGTAAARNTTRLMGVLGLLCAPPAFASVKAIQRGLGGIVGTPIEALSPLVYETGAVKTLEYALLGIILGSIIRTPRSTLPTHAMIGLAFGVVFATIFVSLLFMNAAPGAAVPMPKLAGTAINELIFPVGCSMVLYWVSHMAVRAPAAPAVD